MVIGLLLASISFHFLTIGTGGTLDPNADYPSTWSGLVLFSMVFYVLSYATGIGNLPWQQSELFPISYVCGVVFLSQCMLTSSYAAWTGDKPRNGL